MVVVGSPLVLLNTEVHMVKQYGDKGKCWSLYLRACLEHNTFIIPPSVGDNDHQRQQFKAKLSGGLLSGDVSKSKTAISMNALPHGKPHRNAGPQVNKSQAKESKNGGI